MNKQKLIEGRLLEIKEFCMNSESKTFNDISLNGLKRNGILSIELYFDLSKNFESHEEFNILLHEACQNLGISCVPINSTHKDPSIITNPYQGYYVELF